MRIQNSIRVEAFFTQKKGGDLKWEGWKNLFLTAKNFKNRMNRKWMVAKQNLTNCNSL